MPRPLTTLLNRWSSLKESERLRATGIFVLVLGIVGACLFYWLTPSPVAQQTLDDELPGYARARARETGMLMGHFGVMMLEWQDALERPGSEAVIIAAVSALVASYLFRVAWVQDEDERERLRPQDTPAADKGPSVTPRTPA